MSSIFDWSPTAGSNTSIDGINCASGMPVGNTDNLFRSLAAIIRQTFSSTLQNFLSGSSALGISSGGTGATTAADARTALGLGSAATESTVPVAKGGTGAATATAAIAALGGLEFVAGSFGSPGYVKIKAGGTTFMIAWGTQAVGANSLAAVTYPAAFTTFSRPIPAAMAVSGAGSDSENCGYVSGSATTSGFSLYNANNDAFTVPWIAVGV